jgi:uncharacterized protein
MDHKDTNHDVTERDRAVKELLEKVHTVAIVGLSADESKPSNEVARFLQERGYRIVPVNPGQKMILGEKCYKSLSEIPDKIDIVDIFMRSDKVLPVVIEAIGLRPAAIWLQLGIVNDDAWKAAEVAGVMFIQDRCMKQELTRLLDKG